MLLLYTERISFKFNFPTHSFSFHFPTRSQRFGPIENQTDPSEIDPRERGRESVVRVVLMRDITLVSRRFIEIRHVRGTKIRI